MLRLYTPIQHDIFTLHTFLEKVVCEVWCTACDKNCDDKLEQAFKDIYHYTYNGSPLKDEVERIYDIFKGLTPEIRQQVKEVFITNNDIESLCNGAVPTYLSALPDVVENDIKPLFKWCYETLLEKGKVAGDKMNYYNQLITENDFATCPCCGLIDFESASSFRREAYDHYLPKATYPFASVNFKNLVPLCYKCNSDRKKTKDPIENDRTTFYPFSTANHNIELNINFTADIDNETKNLSFNDLEIVLNGDTPKLETWDWLFDIKDRYGDTIRGFTLTFMKKIERRHQIFLKSNKDWTYENTLDQLIEDYEFDYYEDKKFLKIGLLKALKKDSNLMAVYQ